MKRGAHLHTKKDKALFGKLSEFFRVCTCVHKESSHCHAIFHIKHTWHWCWCTFNFAIVFQHTNEGKEWQHIFTHKYKKHSGLLFRQAGFLKVNVFLPKHVTIAYLSYLSRDFIIFNQSSLHNIQKKEEDNMIFRKCYNSSERKKLEWVSGFKNM